MSTITTIFAILIVILILLVIGNLVFSFIAERKNPPVGKFIECDGVRVHYREWGDTTAPCVVLFHGNGTMIQDLSISGLVDLLPGAIVFCALTVSDSDIPSGRAPASGLQAPRPPSL
jgi:hypothetical protein